MNVRLLSTSRRRNSGWDAEGSDDKAFRRFRPADEVVDALFQELQLYWDSLLEELPILRNNPTGDAESLPREHDAGPRSVLAHRTGIDGRCGSGPLEPSSDLSGIAGPAVSLCGLSGLGALEWSFHSPPWRHLLLIPDNEEMTTWKIRSEERKVAQLVAKRIVKWQIGLDELADNEVSDLRGEWEALLLPALARETTDELWSTIEEGVMR